MNINKNVINKNTQLNCKKLLVKLKNEYYINIIPKETNIFDLCIYLLFVKKIIFIFLSCIYISGLLNNIKTKIYNSI
jgi:hypothetical protein